MTEHMTVKTPDPVETPASSDHRVGVPNHLEGSGETSMVGTILTSGPAAVDTATVEFVRARLNGQAHRFVTASRQGLAVNIADLADLIAEIVTEYADHVTAERDALAEDLAWELHVTWQRTEGGA